MTPRHARRAFTVVEMLAVIGVIAVLMSLLLPAIGGVRRSARAGGCQSNLRQLGVAVANYATQNRDRYPAAILYEMSAAGVATKAWDFEQQPGGSVRAGVLWDFLKGPNEVQQCPEFAGSSTFGADPSTGYNYNTTYLGAEGRLPELAPDGRWRDGWRVARLGLPSAQFRRTTTTAVFGDGGWKGGANKFMRAPSNAVENDLPTIYGGAQAYRHAQCTHCCYLDGHVASSSDRCEGPHSSPSLVSGVLDFPRNGFLSDDDAAYDPR